MARVTSCVCVSVAAGAQQDLAVAKSCEQARLVARQAQDAAIDIDRGAGAVPGIELACLDHAARPDRHRRVRRRSWQQQHIRHAYRTRSQLAFPGDRQHARAACAHDDQLRSRRPFGTRVVDARHAQRAQLFAKQRGAVVALAPSPAPGRRRRGRPAPPRRSPPATRYPGQTTGRCRSRPNAPRASRLRSARERLRKRPASRSRTRPAPARRAHAPFGVLAGKQHLAEGPSSIPTRAPLLLRIAPSLTSSFPDLFWLMPACNGAEP